jgi:hypothetical protein
VRTLDTLTFAHLLTAACQLSGEGGVDGCSDRKLLLAHFKLLVVMSHQGLHLRKGVTEAQRISRAIHALGAPSRPHKWVRPRHPLTSSSLSESLDARDSFAAVRLATSRLCCALSSSPLLNIRAICWAGKASYAHRHMQSGTRMPPVDRYIACS